MTQDFFLWLGIISKLFSGLSSSWEKKFSGVEIFLSWFSKGAKQGWVHRGGNDESFCIFTAPENDYRSFATSLSSAHLLTLTNFHILDCWMIRLIINWMLQIIIIIIITLLIIVKIKKIIYIFFVNFKKIDQTKQ